MKNINAMKNINSFIKSHCGFGGISSVSRRYLVLLTTLLTLGVGNAWADTNIAFSGGNIYFADTYNVHKGATQLAGRKSNCSNGDWYTAVTNLSNIAHTKLYYTSSLEGSGWNNVCWAGWALISNSSGKSNTTDELWNDSQSTWYSGFSSYGLNSNSTYVMTVASSNKGAAVTTTYESSGYSALNHSQTVYKYTSTDNGSSYSAASVNSGTVTISAYKMTGNGTASNTSNSATINTASTTSVSIDAAYTGEVTLTASANAGYTFVGWFDAASGGSPISTSAEYTYNAPNSTKAIYARFKNETTYDVTVSYKCGDGTIHSDAVEAVGVTTHRNITAPTISGFTFSGWTVGDGLNNHTGNTTTNPIEITTKASGSYTLIANYTCDWELRGSMNNWASGYSMTATSSTSVYAEVTLDANNDYQFKFKNGSTWYGVSGDVTQITYTNKGTARAMTNENGNNDNQTMKSAGKGTYRFTWNITNKQVTITYPTSYTVTFDVGTIKGNSRTITAYEHGHYGESAYKINSGDYVTTGTQVQFYAGAVDAATVAATGYGWKGFYGNAAGSDPQLAYTTAYSPTITSNTTIFACFYEIDYYITPYIVGEGSISPNGANGHVATKVSFTATPGTGYKFDNWTQRSGALTIASPDNATTNVNATAASELQANFSPRYAVKVKGAGGSWSANDANLLTGYGEGQIGYVDISLNANADYEIQVYDRQTNQWYGGSTAQNIDYEHSGTTHIYTMATTTTPASAYLKSAAAGTYRFAWNLTGNKVTVEYPTSRFITSGQKTEGQSDEAGGSFTALDGSSNDVKGGKFVANNASVTFEATPNTGYNFDGWYTNEACTEGKDANNPMTVSSITTDKTIYAKFAPETYSITLTRTGTGYGSGGDASVTATFNQTLPAATMPTAAAGYHFMGYFTEAAGAGTKFIDENGEWIAGIENYTDADKKWIRNGGIELFAYFKKAEITNIDLNATVFDPVTEGEGYVIANPTLDPTPADQTIICWELQYDNGSLVTGHAAIDTKSDERPNEVKFSIAGLAAGSYKIKATLRAGSTCDATSLSEREVSFSIASGFTVTIQYKDAEGNTIAPSTTTPGKATEWTSVTAPDIFGYTFSTWVLGDGITKHDDDDLTKRESFRFKATFNGTLTAKYTKNKYIYLDLSQKFSETDYWDNPHVYFYSGNPWNTNGTGASGHSNYISGHAMTQIGESKIWYFDYGSVSNPSQYIAFTWGNNTSQSNFNGIDVIFRGDFTEGTPLFVPTVGQEKSTTNGAKYYNKGYWTNYVGNNTGYSVIIYDNSTNAELKRQRFTSVNNDMRMTMKAALDLDAAKTYKIEILRDNGKYYKNGNTLTSTNCTNWEFTENATKGSITSTAAGSYIFTLGYSDNNSDKNYELRLTVEYPAAANDFQVLYNDNAQWSLGSAHTSGWVHPSRVLRARENGVDTISFFVAQGEGISAQLKARKVSSIDAGTGTITWESLNINEATSQSLTVDSAAVWNFKVTQGTTAGTIASIEKIGAYTGNYYIRCNALNSNWDNYTTDGDHMMTYSSFSESAANSFGEKYSHYKAKWCPRNTNIAFCIANDYSPCITDTLKQDVGNPYSNTDAEGTLNNDGDNNHSGSQAYLDRFSANVRFMWNRKTNKISRAYVSAATSGRAKFLVLQGNVALKNEAGSATISDEGMTNGILFSDKENWIYERTLQIKPNTKFKLYACYANATPTEANAQYFRGNYAENVWDAANTVVLIGGESETYQLARVVYDFKTNRLLAAWMPSGSDVSGDVDINADVMVVREHHESAQCITFADDKAKLSDVKTVYGVMRFNRWILNNRQYPENQNKNEADLAHHPPLPVAQQKSVYERRLYFISFPFDVRVGDIFGFGQYGQYWVIQYYDGLNRAKNGYWSDSKPNWKYVSPSMVSQGYTLKANEGYILELNLNAMAADNTTFWSNGISTIELYFPSTVAQQTLKQTNCTIPALSADYECKINRGTGTDGDRRVKDSYWRCIGVPSYNLYNSTLKDGSGADISWNTNYTWQPDDRAFPFIYVWNKTDNTLTPQSTSAFTFQPMHAYLTQIKSKIVWTAVSAKDVSSIVARRARKEADNEHEWRIELRQDSTFLDQTYVRMSNMEQVTDSFDFGQDMIKELNSRSNIYTYIGYEKVAANSMTVHSDQTTVIPVGANIRADGEYTFAMPDGTSGVGVTLIDNVENTRTNLSALDYTVTLSAGEYTNRFFLEISPVQNTPTDIEAVSGQPSEVRKVMIDGILYIVRDGKMYDARGTLVHGSAR